MNARSDDDRALGEAIAAALDSVGRDAGEAIAALRRRSEQQRRVVKWLIMLSAGLVLAVGLSIALLVDSVSTSHKVEDVQRRTSQQVLCPLYGAFLAASNNPPPDNIKDNPKELKEREEAFGIIREGATILGCKFATVGGMK